MPVWGYGSKRPWVMPGWEPRGRAHGWWGSWCDQRDGSREGHGDPKHPSPSPASQTCSAWLHLHLPEQGKSFCCQSRQF